MDQQQTTGSRRLESIFRFLVARRWWVVAIYALLLVPAAYFAMQVQQDNAVDRLMVRTDPDYVTAREFQQVFGQAEYVVLIFEAQDPFAPAVLRRFVDLEHRLDALPKVESNSVVSLYRRAKAGFEPTPEQSEALRRFATGAALFREQGLVGDSFLGLPLLLDIRNNAERQEVMAAIGTVTDEIERSPAPFIRLRKVGQPYVTLYLDRDTRSTSSRYFPLFGLFVVIITLFLYRSWRALVAFLITLGVSVALTVGFIGATGGEFTIVSAMVPMTVLITCMATLVYVHSRFVDRPPERPVDEHQLFALQNKLLPCTASIFATAVGFAALAVSKIRPIREMGIWVAVGLVFVWVVVFTLFPALQKILRTPTLSERKAAGAIFLRYARWLPPVSYRYRWLLVPAALGLCVAGLVALFGLRGVVSPMKLETKQVEYINHGSTLYHDTKYVEQVMAGLSMTEIWLRGKLGDVTEPAVVVGLQHFEDALKRQPEIGAVVSFPAMLRMLRYVGGKGERLPEDAEALEKVIGDVETLLPSEPMLKRFVDPKTFGQTHLAVISKTLDYEGYVELERLLRRLWAEAVARDSALGVFEMKTTGMAPLQAKIAHHMVPTLVESFILSAVIIFAAFLVVFRNGAARLMAMIPSLFAILVMFLIMRAMGMMLNVATILIATTILGTSENDQIHFFYHFLEKRRQGSTEEGLRHTLVVAGRAIWSATLINAGGFLAFAVADLPPIRQFGTLSAVAFLLSMIADFTALPAALWLVFRDRPDALKATAASAAAAVAVAGATGAGGAAGAAATEESASSRDSTRLAAPRVAPPLPLASAQAAADCERDPEP